uniref:F-box domain-containing protein n=1 Tax=Brassica oleracea var. oleracea TaxID=109376 RepID=A0A0D3C7K4_BRAOL
MESLHQKHHQTILTRFSKYSEQIPDDLITEILLRLPSRSIARFRCVCKLWDSTISRQDFTKSFLTRSSSRPQILFACGKNNLKLFLSSSPQPHQNTDENSSSIAANYHMSLPCGRFYTLGHIGCLVYVREGMSLWKICNPSTGQCFTLPEVKIYSWIRTFFGYDPIEKQVKVLTITGEHGEDNHQVLTLETDKMSWRTIEYDTPHSPISAGVCISGVLYYRAYEHSFPDPCMMIVCFDVRSEKYSFIRVRESSLGAMEPETTTLINYNGQLASLEMQRSFSEASTSFDLWVPQDSGKEEWSKHTYKFPMLRNEAIHDTLYFIVGTNEIVLIPRKVSDPFYVFYYNLERKTSRSVEIRGMKEVKGKKVFAYLDHIEDLKLM